MFSYTVHPACKVHWCKVMTDIKSRSRLNGMGIPIVNVIRCKCKAILHVRSLCDWQNRGPYNHDALYLLRQVFFWLLIFTLQRRPPLLRAAPAIRFGNAPICLDTLRESRCRRYYLSLYVRLFVRYPYRGSLPLPLGRCYTYSIFDVASDSSRSSLARSRSCEILF